MEYPHAGRQWTLVNRGRVGFLLEDIWANWWREGGSRIYAAGPRVTGLQLPRRGWRRGIFITGIYAPTSDSTVADRQQLRDQVNQVASMATATSIQLLAGDLNAELGNNLTESSVGREAVGRFGHSRVSTAGWEWRQWAVQNGFKDCSSRFQLRHRWTWRHPRYLTEHELDHFFIHEDHLWHLVQCRIIQEGPNVDWPWSSYTDHNPVEITLRHGKMWGSRSRRTAHHPKPDILKIRGSTSEATRLRQMWVEEVETRLETVAEHAADMEAQWETISTVCREVAVQICGVMQKREGAPWLHNRDDEVQQLDRHIAQARDSDRITRQNPHNLPPHEHLHQKRLKRQALNQARKHKRDTLTGWEEAWLTSQAQAADQAATRQDMGTVFRIVKELANAEDTQRRFGCRSENNPDEAAEEWRQHFQSIQAGIGQVPDEVWDDISPFKMTSVG
eukprot:s4145_g2.t1